LDFLEPIHCIAIQGLSLDPRPVSLYSEDPGESVGVPPDYAAEMMAHDTRRGREFRVHYAGFFDPSFSWDQSAGGSRAVLEVRSHEGCFLLEHGQTVGWLRYEEPMAGRPDRLYGRRKDRLKLSARKVWRWQTIQTAGGIMSRCQTAVYALAAGMFFAPFRRRCARSCDNECTWIITR